LLLLVVGLVGVLIGCVAGAGIGFVAGHFGPGHHDRGHHRMYDDGRYGPYRRPVFPGPPIYVTPSPKPTPTSS
jgi:hypothetical protein